MLHHRYERYTRASEVCSVGYVEAHRVLFCDDDGCVRRRYLQTFKLRDQAEVDAALKEMPADSFTYDKVLKERR
jgi:hypothetical protein